MKKQISIIISIIIIISFNSCSNSDDSKENLNPTSTEIIEGFRVSINGNVRIFNVAWVEQFVYLVGTPDEYTSLIVRGEIESNSIERIHFSLLKGKTGSSVVSQLQYFDNENRGYYYYQYADNGAFLINVITNEINNNIVKGIFSGTLQENGGGNVLNFTSGSFNISY